MSLNKFYPKIYNNDDIIDDINHNIMIKKVCINKT